MSFDSVILLSDIIVTPLDLGKIQRELFKLNEFLNTSRGSLPLMSSELKNIVRQSELNLLKAEDRERLNNQLQLVRRTAPVVQISFAAEPNKQELRPLVRWFRQNGHPNTLINVGVQPSLAGGCIVRTKNKTFDFSLQKILQNNREKLAKTLL